MVSLLELAQITEEGVRFQSPIDGTSMLLTPEESIRCQNEIGADIIMQLDDVVSSVSTDQERFAEATARSVRWLDRCIAAHTRKHDQNLFAIIQGGLDVSPGGLRDQCLKEMIARDTPGYAIGGLAGGEDKDSFWRVVAHCAAALPPNKPRYLMGVGYTLDLLVCVCLGVDMFDCVFPTRTARFGVALVWEGSVKLKMHCYVQDRRPISEQCSCQTCRNYTRAYLHSLLKTNSPLAAQLITIHNICHMLTFMRDLRNSIVAGTEALHTFVNDYLRANFTSDTLPQWVRDALVVADVPVLL
jgi:queuine tRNA-ribosyltransferase